MLLALLVLVIGNQARADVLVGTSYYKNAVASSTFGAGYGVDNLFDRDTATQWAIAGAAGGNPQGQGEGWISFNLDKAYTINSLLFAARSTNTSIDGLNSLSVWIGTSSFGVDVTDASPTSANSTIAFLTNNPTATWTSTGPFTTTESEYALSTPVYGQYIVARFTETSPNASLSNLGGATFLVNVAVPEPGTLLLGGIAAVCGGGGVWWKRRKKNETEGETASEVAPG